MAELCQSDQPSQRGAGHQRVPLALWQESLPAGADLKRRIRDEQLRSRCRLRTEWAEGHERFKAGPQGRVLSLAPRTNPARNKRAGGSE
jgi:hypothetical protein